MNRKFEEVLDECVDRINRGEGIEACLKRYPEHAEELKPLLRATIDVRAAGNIVPSSAAKAAARQRFDMALSELEQKKAVGHQFFHWSKMWVSIAATAAVVILAVVGYFGVGPALMPPDPASQISTSGNFRFLVSDAVNDMKDFQHLYVTISRIGMHRSSSDNTIGEWLMLEPNIPTVDLRPLEGPNSLVLWSGNITPGDYDKVFLYVDNVTGVLNNGQTMEIKLPSNKLQISMPFTVNNEIVNFVYDVTVVRAGESGKYLLRPQLAESGANQAFKEVRLKETEERGKSKEAQSKLRIRVEGQLDPGKQPTVTVTDDGTPAADATVTINGREHGTTDADGRLKITLPHTSDELRIGAVSGNKQAALGIELEGSERQFEYFEGVITDISRGQPNSSPWRMTLKGVRGPVTVNVTKVEGTPEVGARAEVQGVLTGNTIDDASAEVQSKGQGKVRDKSKD